MERAVIYIHGKGGSAEEAEHYKPLFPEACVIGFDYQAQAPWEAAEEFAAFFEKLRKKFGSIIVVANSIGAFFAMNALNGAQIEKAYFISPIVNMEKLITDMMQWAGVTEDELREKGTIETPFGETLSAEYLNWVRTHPVSWSAPTAILYGENDSLQSADTVRAFAEKTGAELTVMENGEHWFHTEEQMAFLDKWISRVRQEGKLLSKMIKTERLDIYPALKAQMEAFIETQELDILKAAYSEMLEGAVKHPDKWEWYAIWMIELKSGAHIGELCFKGLDDNGAPEIGYGIAEEYQGKGYATEAVNAVAQWALKQDGVRRIEAEAEESNIASVKVLEKCGFIRNGVIGEEGPRFVRYGR